MADSSNAPPAQESLGVSASRPPRRGSLFQYIGGMVLASTVAAAVAVPWLLSDPARTARLIASALGDSADVSVERSRVGWLQPLLIEGISITPRDGGPQPIAIRRIEGNRGLLGMLAGFGDLGRFRVEGLAVDVVFDDQRRSNLAAIFPPKTPESGSLSGKRRRAAVSTEIEIDQAVVTINGPWTDKPWVSEPIDVALALEPEPGEEHSRWRIDQVTLLEEATLDPTVSEGVLAYIAPILADATILHGKFSLSLESASLPVGDPIAGSLEGRLVMHQVDVGPGPLARHVIELIPGETPRLSSLRISEGSDIRFTLADRRVTHEGLRFGIPLRQPGRRLDVESAGSVGIDDGSLATRLTLPLPTEMPAKRPLLQALAGKQLGLSIAGTLDKPTVDFDGTLRATLGEFVGLPMNRPPGAAVPPPPKPGFVRPATGVGPASPKAGQRSEVPVPPQPESLPSPKTPRPPEKLIPPADATEMTAKERSAQEPSAVGDVASAVAEQIRSRLPPEAAANGTTDAVVDLVSGVLEEVARRRAAKKAAEAAQQTGDQDATKASEQATPSTANGQPTGDDERPRGRLLRRLRDRLNSGAPQPSPSPPASTPPADAPADATGGEG